MTARSDHRTLLERNGPAAFLIDPFRPTRDHAHAAYRLPPGDRLWAIPMLIGAAMLVLSVVGFFVDHEQFLFSYLIAWFFCLTVSLGALFFVMVHHIVRAQWSTVVRRIPEALMWTFPLLAILSIPILLGMNDIYHWTDAGHAEPGHEPDPVLLAKQPYLNIPFFLARLVFYFGIWSFMAYRLFRYSVEQDLNPDPRIPARQRRVSAWGIPVFAVTTAFASYDLVMSTDPHWFSTMFGVYIFSGLFWVINAVIILVIALLQQHDALRRTVSVEHFHDLGKWLFAFTVFWAYIAFSQYMLIWYGNLPEETVWYMHRLSHGWQIHSAVLLFGHFVLPFLILLPRRAKRIKAVLVPMAVWALVMQWFDLHWLIMPVHHEAGGFHWLDFTTFLGLFGLYTGILLWRLGRHSLVPQNDPTLARSLGFQNV